MFRASQHPLLRSSSLQRIAWRFGRNAKKLLKVDHQYLYAFGSQASRLSSSSSRDPLDNARSMPLALLARNKRPLYSRDNEYSLATTSKPWHDPSFLSDAQPPEKEEWLAALLQSTGQPDVHAFALVLKSISTWKHGSAPKRAEHWMSRLSVALSAAVDEHTPPGILELTNADTSAFIEGYLRCHLYTIQAWANAEAEDPIISVNRAEAWLNKAKNVSTRVPAKDIQSLLTECHNAFLDICSKGRKSRTKRNASEIHASKAEATLRAMITQYKRLLGESPVRPNTESVNFVMRAINQCKKDTDIAIRCKDLLHWMEKSDEQSHNTSSKLLVICPNPKSYNLWLNALASVARTKAKKCARKRRAPSVALDDGTEEMKVLQQAVDHMRDLFQRGRLGVIEDNIPYNILLSAWAGIAGVHSRHAPMQAEKIFNEMMDLAEHQNFPEVAPDAASYLQVIRAWATSGSERAGERASWWIDQQWSDYEKSDNENLMPTTHTYTTAINAWSKAGNPKRAEELLLQFLKRYEKLKVSQLEPNTEIYSAIIQAWLNAAESKENSQTDKVKALNRAAEWLEGLVRGESESGPATRHDIFLNTLKAARHCAKHSPDVLETASRVFNHLRNSSHYVQPVAYAYLLQIGLSALPEPENDLARTKFLTELVTVCCEDGFLSRSFVVSLTNGPIQREGWTAYESARISCILFPDWPTPPSWTRNVQKKLDLPRAEDFQRTRFKFGDQEY